jgi:hypothetical protein
MLKVIASVVPMVVGLDRFGFADQNNSTGLELQLDRSVKFLPLKLLK